MPPCQSEIPRSVMKIYIAKACRLLTQAASNHIVHYLSLAVVSVANGFAAQHLNGWSVFAVEVHSTFSETLPELHLHLLQAISYMLYVQQQYSLHSQQRICVCIGSKSLYLLCSSSRNNKQQQCSSKILVFPQ